jgi:nucleotide-binding universal stress UspA family protein
MYRAILAPLDGSAFGEQALPLACSLAAAAEAALHLAHVEVVYPVLYVEGLPVIDAEMQSLSEQHARAYIEAAAERVRADHPDLPFVSALLEPPVAEGLAAYAAANAIDLVVMTTHGRGGLSRLWLGSVADALVRRCAAPVLLIRPQPDDSPPAPQIRHITIPLDGSALAEQILPHAIDVARLTGARLRLVQVVEPFQQQRMTPGIDLVKLEQEINGRRCAEAQQYLRSVKQRLTAQGFTVDTCVTLARQPALAILDEARDSESSLVALATQGHGGLTRLLLGSVADKIVRGAEIPVLLFRPRHVPEQRGRAATAGTDLAAAPPA